MEGRGPQREASSASNVTTHSFSFHLYSIGFPFKNESREPRRRVQEATTVTVMSGWIWALRGGRPGKNGCIRDSLLSEAEGQGLSQLRRKKSQEARRKIKIQ